MGSVSTAKQDLSTVMDWSISKKVMTVNGGIPEITNEKETLARLSRFIVTITFVLLLSKQLRVTLENT